MDVDIRSLKPSAGTRLLVPILLVIVLSAGTYSAPAEPSSAVTVEMTNRLKFAPDTIRIAVGDTVTWRNSSMLMHTVTADPEQATLDGSVRLPDGATSFNSGNMDPDDVFTHTFGVPGTYRYFCIPHEGAKMIGTVIVSAGEQD